MKGVLPSVVKKDEASSLSHGAEETKEDVSNSRDEEDHDDRQSTEGVENLHLNDSEEEEEEETVRNSQARDIARKIFWGG